MYYMLEDVTETMHNKFLIGRIGDHLPDKLVIHLPSSLTVKAVYERMVEEMTTCSMLHSTVSQPQFYNLWKEFYPQVSIPTVSMHIQH